MRADSTMQSTTKFRLYISWSLRWTFSGWIWPHLIHAHAACSVHLDSGWIKNGMMEWGCNPQCVKNGTNRIVHAALDSICSKKSTFPFPTNFKYWSRLCMCEKWKFLKIPIFLRDADNDEIVISAGDNKLPPKCFTTFRFSRAPILHVISGQIFCVRWSENISSVHLRAFHFTS